MQETCLLVFCGSLRELHQHDSSAINCIWIRTANSLNYNSKSWVNKWKTYSFNTLLASNSCWYCLSAHCLKSNFFIFFKEMRLGSHTVGFCAFFLFSWWNKLVTFFLGWYNQSGQWEWTRVHLDTKWPALHNGLSRWVKRTRNENCKLRKWRFILD